MTATITRREFGATAATAAVFTERALQAQESAMIQADMDRLASVSFSGGFGERLRKAREARGLSVEQCAFVIDPANVNFWHSSWQFWEDGGDLESLCSDHLVPLWPTLEALLGVPVAVLLHSGADRAYAKQCVAAHLADFDPDAPIEADSKPLPEMSETLRQLRQGRELTAAQAGAKVGITERDWLRYENGGPPQNFKAAGYIADSFGLSLNELCKPTELLA